MSAKEVLEPVLLAPSPRIESQIHAHMSSNIGAQINAPISSMLLSRSSGLGTMCGQNNPFEAQAACSRAAGSRAASLG
jgi:hypothetical protein